jgi:hypothetical protein
MADSVKQLGEELVAKIVAEAKEDVKKKLGYIAEFVPQALELAAAKSENKLDDLAVAALKQKLEEVLKEMVAKI